MELVEIKPLKNSILGLPRVNGRLPEQRKRLTISVELVALSLIFMDEPTSGMQGLPPLLFLGHHIFKSVDEATEGVLDGHYPATWKLDVTTFSRKSKMSFDFAQIFDNLRCREQDQLRTETASWETKSFTHAEAQWSLYPILSTNVEVKANPTSNCYIYLMVISPPRISGFLECQIRSGCRTIPPLKPSHINTSN
ncbi:hypothetical protein YC2023_042854 [Brassica napus]